MEPATVYLSSPTRDAAAKQGLGSPQALAGIVLSLGALGVATVNGVLLSPDGVRPQFHPHALTLSRG